MQEFKTLREEVYFKMKWFIMIPEDYDVYMSTPCFPVNCAKGGNFMTFFLLPWITRPFKTEVYTLECKKLLQEELILTIKTEN